MRRLMPLCLLLLPLLSCGTADRDDVPRLNVLLLTIDTLRADRMSLYGYERPTTPEIDAFAATATVWDRAMTPSSWTRASFASYFTGLYPATHGCENRGGMMSEDLHTLAERFREAGWATAGVYANANVAAEIGFDQGFDLYDSPPTNAGYPRGHRMIDAAAVNERTIKWLREERPVDQPWFLFMLYIDPHDPYLPHEDHEFGEERPTRYLDGSRRVLRAMDRGETTKKVELIKAINRNLYDGEVAYVDRHVGAIFDELEALGLAETTVVIVTADHGEGLWDHHEYRSHGEQVYQQQIHVPLLMRWPGRTEAGARVEHPVGVIDVFGTLAGEFGLAGPEEHESGSLFAPYDPDRPLYVDELVGRIHKRAVYDWPWKLILNRGADAELYDLDADPGELASLAGTRPEVVDRLRAVADSFAVVGETRRLGLKLETGPVELDEETKRQLEALGYIH